VSHHSDHKGGRKGKKGKGARKGDSLGNLEPGRKEGKKNRALLSGKSSYYKDPALDELQEGKKKERKSLRGDRLRVFQDKKGGGRKKRGKSREASE